MPYVWVDARVIPRPLSGMPGEISPAANTVVPFLGRACRHRVVRGSETAQTLLVHGC